MSDLGPKQIEAQLLIEDRLRSERKGAFVGKPIMESVNERQYDDVAAATGKDANEIRELVDALAAWEAGSRLVAACLPELEQAAARGRLEAVPRLPAGAGDRAAWWTVLLRAGH